MVTPLNERLKFILKTLNLSGKEFGKACDIDQATVSRTLLGHSIPRCDALERIYRTYPTINPHYLLTGEGNPFQTHQKHVGGGDLDHCLYQVRALEKEVALLTELLDMYRKRDANT